jgi:hypothetical protein
MEQVGVASEAVAGHVDAMKIPGRADDETMAAADCFVI